MITFHAMIEYFKTYIVLFFLINWGLWVIRDKYQLNTKFGRVAPFRWMHDMSECEFCMDHHAAVIVAPLFGMLFGWNWILLAFPFASAALSNILKALTR